MPDPFDPLDLLEAVDGSPLPALGTVLTEGRGSLPFTLLHGESLVAVAAWALGEAGVRLLDVGTPVSAVAEAEAALVLHDSLCPGTPPDFLAGCVDRAVADGVAVVGTRPVTDTVKRVRDGWLGETLDRDELLHVVSPLVLPPARVADLGALPEDDLAELVVRLRTAHGVDAVVAVEAPPAALRVGGPDDVRLLEALLAAEG